MFNFRKLKIGLLRWMPRKKELAGGFAHKLIGDRLFDSRIWKLSSKTFGGGLALGTFLAFTIPPGLQLIVAAALAILFRVNMPAALMATWINNPFTMPIVYPLEYQLGSYINEALTFFQYEGQVKSMKWLKGGLNWVTGGLVIGTLFSLTVYFFFTLFFRWLKIHKTEKKTAPLKIYRDPVIKEDPVIKNIKQSPDQDEDKKQPRMKAQS